MSSFQNIVFELLFRNQIFTNDIEKETLDFQPS